MRKLLLLATLLALSTSGAFAQSDPLHLLKKPAVAATKVAVAASAATSAPAKFTASQIQQNPFILLENLATADLTAALADANAQVPPDTVGANCYSALISLKSNPAFALPTGGVPGVFTAIQKGRDLKVQLANIVSPNGPLANLNAACAAWTQDNIATLIAIGGAVGLVANPVGLTATVGGAAAGLPAAMAAFLAAIPK